VCGRVLTLLTEILTVFRKTVNHFIITRCINLVINILGLYRQVWLSLAQWFIQAGMADTGIMAFTARGMADTGTVAYIHAGMAILAQRLLQAGMADTGTMAYTGRYGGY